VVWLGGRSNALTAISQNIDLPVDHPGIWMSFYHWIGSKKENCGEDKAYVKVNNNTLESYDLCKANDIEGWQQEVLNLDAFVGEPATIQFSAQTDGDDKKSDWFIDSVTLCDNSAAHPCP
jgi:hypothetical protein